MRGHLTLALAAALPLIPGALHSESLVGSFTNQFNGDLNVWDISGTYSDNLDGLDVQYTANTDAAGKITGSGTANIDNYFEGVDVNLNMGLAFQGSITTAGSATRVNMTMKMSGNGTVMGYNCTCTATVTERVEIDSATRQLIGNANGRVTVALPDMHRKASQAIPRFQVQDSLPDDATGNWDLVLNTTTTNRAKYVGDGTVELPNGKSLPFTIRGTFNPKSDVSKLTLKGVDFNRAMNMSISACCTNAQLALKNLSGKVMGQKVKLTGH